MHNTEEPTVRALVVDMDCAIAGVKAIIKLADSTGCHRNDSMTALSLNAALDKHLARYHQARCEMQETYQQEMDLLPNSTKSLIANTQPLESYQARVPAASISTAFTREQLDRWHSQDIRYHNWMRICMDVIAAEESVAICATRAENEQDTELREHYRERIDILKDTAVVLTRFVRDAPITEIDDHRENIKAIQDTALAVLPAIRQTAVKTKKTAQKAKD